jgi:PAS domain S-box-containing protein
MPLTQGTQNTWNRSRLARRLAVTLTLVISLTATFVAWWAARRQIKRFEQARFERIVDQTMESIRLRILAQQVVLGGAAGFMAESPDADGERFERYVKALALNRDYPGVKGMGYLPATASADRSAAGVRIAVVIDPACRRMIDRIANGGPEYQTAQEIALDGGAPAATASVPMETAKLGVGIVWFAPVYWPGVPREGTHARAVALRGWVYAAIDAGLILEAALPSEHDDIDMDLYDGTKTTKEHLLGDTCIEIDGEDAADASFTARRAVDLGGRSAVLLFHSNPQFTASGDANWSTGVLVSGLVTTFLLVCVAWAVLRTGNRAHAIAQRMTVVLREQTQLLRSIIDHIPNVVFWKDRNLAYLGCNRLFAQMAGLKDPGEIVGKTDYDMPWTREETEFYRQCDRQVMDGGAPMLDIEETSRTATGRMIIHTSKVPLVGPNDKVFGILGIYADVTQRKRAEEALRESEERFHIMADGSPMMIWVTDAEGGVQFVNRTYREFFNMPFASVAGMGWKPLLHPDDAPAHLEKFLHSIRERAPFDAEARVRRADGQWRWITCRAEPRTSAGGEFLGHVGISLDITESKIADEVLRTRMAALDAAADMILITNVQGGIEYVNPAFTAATGYAADEAVGQNPRILNSGLNSDEFYTQLWNTIRAGRVWKGELMNRRKNGEVYPEEMTITPVRDAAGVVTRFVSIKRDVTLNRARQALEQERGHLKQAVAAMEQVLGIVGHELRSPLAGIRALAEVLMMDQITAQEQDGFIKSIHDEVVRMSGTINDLLEAARMNSGQAHWNWSMVEVDRMCREAAEGIAPLVNPDAVRLSVVAEPPELCMKGDAQAVRRLVLNLLSNAAKHTATGSISVVARAFEHEGRPWVRIEVADTGVGISAEICSRLGEAFALNSGVVGSKHVQGTGLGLAICKAIAAAHDGWLSVRSSPDSGTTITASLRADLDAPASTSSEIRLVDASAGMTEQTA